MSETLRRYNYHITYLVDCSQAPWLHLGNGGWSHASGRATLGIRVGDFSIYQLDAKDLPIPVGSHRVEVLGNIHCLNDQYRSLETSTRTTNHQLIEVREWP